MFSISIRIKKSPSDIIVKDIKSTLLFRPRLLKNLKSVIENYLKIEKTYFNITTTLNTHTPIIKTKSIRLYAEGLAIKL